ncbi:unnamed protein product [Alopecurus aequalis]
MGATTVLPPSLLPHRSTAADLHSCAPRRLRLDPSCMANLSATKKTKRPSSSVPGEETPVKRVRGGCSRGEPHLAAAVNNKKRPSSVRGGEPAAKRVRGVGGPHLAAAVKIGSKKLPCPSSGKDLKVSTRLDAAVIKNQSVHPASHLPESTAQPKPSPVTLCELIQKARQAKARSAAEEAAMEIERRRTEARQKVKQIVATVEFNDPFLDPADVFMTRQQLREAREEAAGAQARIIEKARQREMEALRRSESRNSGHPS